MKILDEALTIKDQIINDRHHLHRNPEIGFYLPETAAYVQKRLAEMGIQSQIVGGSIDEKIREKFVFAGFPDMEASTGVAAVIGQGEPCILLRADMDALPMEEAIGLVDFRSENPGKAHMCGHDTHTAMLLGAARILKNHEKELKGTVKLMFQTGEECGCGSRFMIEAGVLENPKVHAAFAMHVMANQTKGTVGYTGGICSAAMDTFMLKIQGKGTHSSEPQKGIDPLMIANQVYTTLNLFTGREIDPRETVAFTVGQCGGGTAANVIPDTAEVMAAARTFNRDVTEHIVQRVPELIDHTVKMWRGKYELKTFHTPSTFNDNHLFAELKSSIEGIVGADQLMELPCMAGTEDFGYISEQVPSVFIVLGAGNKDAAPMHNPNMVVDDDLLPVGSAIHANVAMKWLESHA